MCLEDAPSAGTTETDPTALVGLTFDANAQCQAQMGPDAFFCTGLINVSYAYSYNLQLFIEGMLCATI